MKFEHEERDTRSRVLATLLQEGPATASVLAGRLGVSATAIRQHLDQLVESGEVESRERPPYGPTELRGRGRPARYFTLTKQGRDRFPQAYDALAVQALRSLEHLGGSDAVTEFARARQAEVEARYSEQVAGLPSESRSAALAQALTVDGFAASVVDTPSGQGQQLCQHHCPVAHVAAEFPQICEAETEAFARLLGTHVQRLATIGHGDHVCTTYVPLSTEGTPRQ